jgi:TnpA family transposase
MVASEIVPRLKNNLKCTFVTQNKKTALNIPQRSMIGKVEEEDKTKDAYTSNSRQSSVGKTTSTPDTRLLSSLVHHSLNH